MGSLDEGSPEDLQIFHHCTKSLARSKCGKTSHEVT